MISDPAIAKKISDLMLEFGSRLDASVADVADHCKADELNRYRQAVGSVMADMLIEIMNPLYAMHPEIKPAELR